MSPAIRQQWPEFMQKAWDETEPSQRFTYKMNRALVGFLLFLLAIIWGFFAYTSIVVSEWTPWLTAFVSVYLPFTIFIVFQMLRWRAFTVLSTIIIGKKELFWVHGTQAYRSPLRNINKDRIGLDELGKGNQLEGFLKIDLGNDEQGRLYIFRPYAYINDLESFMEIFLKYLQGKK